MNQRWTSVVLHPYTIAIFHILIMKPYKYGVTFCYHIFKNNNRMRIRIEFYKVKHFIYTLVQILHLHQKNAFRNKFLFIIIKQKFIVIYCFFLSNYICIILHIIILSDLLISESLLLK